jgi:hypothetical protein
MNEIDEDVASKWEVPPEPVLTPEDLLLLKERRARLSQSLRELLSRLGSREVQVLRLRYGLGSEKPHTLKVTGDLFGGLSKERVRQIECKALRKLRHPSRSKKLADFTEGWDWWDKCRREEERELERKMKARARNKEYDERRLAAEHALRERAAESPGSSNISWARLEEARLKVEAEIMADMRAEHTRVRVIRQRETVSDFVPGGQQWLDGFLAAQNAWIAENLRQKQARMAAEEQTDGLG